MKVGVRRGLIWGVVGAAVLALLWIALSPRPVEADLAAVERGPMQVTLDEEGETRVRDRFVVSAPLAGRVLRIGLEPGDPVVADETTLATFLPADPTLLDARSRREAEARVRSAEASLDRARADREYAAAELAFAASELQRFRQLAADGVVSQSMLDGAELNERTRREALQASESAMRTAHFELERARASLVQETGGGGDRSIVLRSPVDGVVLRRLRESEAVVPAGDALLVVGDPSKLEVVADFLSIDAVRIRPGRPARIEQWGGEGALAGRVRRVEPSGFTKISALGVEEQRVNVILDFDEPRQAWTALGDAYRVEVRVVVWEDDDVVKAPMSSLFRHGEGWAAYVVAGGRARLRQVELGRRNGREAQILAGLDPGEQVITHPSEAVGDGSAVTERRS